MRIRLLAFLLLIPAGLLFGQQRREISGTVVDANNSDPLPGATIIVKGTQMGAVTDMDGEFAYSISSENIEDVVLVVSYIGYKSQSVRVRDKSNFKFYLEEDINSLEEVVITSSYGTKKLKQEVVGSISNIKTRDIIVEQSVTSFDQLLEGQTAGVYIEGSSEVGAPVNIHVRGQGSLSPLNNSAVGTSTQPLIIVDGVILAEEVALDGNSFFDGAGGISEDFMNPLAKIGIKDIESINVLKDAAAVSLYGADGANGVIVITTKGGKKGPMKFAFSAQGGASSAINRIEYMNGEQFQEIRNIYYTNNGSPENVQDWNGVNTDWYDLLNKTGTFQRYNFSFSGGGNRLNYRTSLGYQDIQESQVKNDFSKYNTNFSLSYEGEKFSAGMKLSPTYTVKNSPNTLFNYAVPPTLAPYDELGNYTRFDYYGNPLAVANQNRGLTETFALLNSFNASYNILENLELSTLFGMDFSNKDQDNYFSGLNQTGIDNSGNVGYRILRERNTRRWNWNARLAYSKIFATHHYFDLLAGVEARQNLVNFSFHRGRNFPEPGVIMPVETATIQQREEDRSENTGRSFFSQLNYDFQKKYFLLANFRIDQSSVFGTDNNTSYNGGLGASWVISNEGFMENVGFLEFLRTRVSYGTSGNSRIGSYRALGLYTFDDHGGNGYNRGNYANPTTAPNPYLGWEKNYKFNTGIDITTSFGLSLNVEFFNDFIQDMIVSRGVIPETGYGSVQINGADMYNRGIEVGVRGNIVSRSNFKWMSQFNVSHIKNRVTHLQGLGSNFSSAEVARAQRIGYPTSVIWGYDFAGIDPATGRELFLFNGELIDGLTVMDHYRDKENWQPIGNSQPDFFGGFNNRFSVGRHITIAVNTSYRYGSYTMVQKEMLDHYRVIFSRNLPVNIYYDAWRAPGDIALYPAIVNNQPLISNSSKYLYNTSRIKLNSVNFSYNIPVKGSKLPFNSFRVFANGSNLWYWHLDKAPEGRNGIAEMRSAYPEMRTFSLGVNVNF